MLKVKKQTKMDEYYMERQEKLRNKQEIVNQITQPNCGTKIAQRPRRYKQKETKTNMSNTNPNNTRVHPGAPDKQPMSAYVCYIYIKKKTDMR